MRKIIALLIVGFVALNGYVGFKSHGVAITKEQQENPIINKLKTGQGSRGKEISSTREISSAHRSQRGGISYSVGYRCDGRTYCSQMTSFEEAMFFLNNCPGVKMDGDHDGVPCEMQFNK
jgi:hypothetical protein